MAFYAKYTNPYWEADVSKIYDFENEWQICAINAEKLPYNVDSIANTMHDTVVQETIKKIGAINEFLQ